MNTKVYPGREEMRNKIWKNGMRVKFEHPVTGKETFGIMRGYSTTELAVIGRGMIIEVDDVFALEGAYFNLMIVMEYSVEEIT